jgi:DNA-3-methyladenine glycosylase II
MTDRDLEAGFVAVVDLDPDLATILDRYGQPHVRSRPQGFASLLKIIVEQQVSLASAAAIWGRVEAGLQTVTPERVLAFDIDTLRGFGLSLPKARYAHALAQAVRDGDLDFDRLVDHDDELAIAELTRVKGIGRWTAEIYLLSALQRPDMWPAADIALMASAQDVKSLPARPNAREMVTLAEGWRPWRTYAARLLWHHYRHTRGRAVPL